MKTVITALMISLCAIVSAQEKKSKAPEISISKLVEYHPNERILHIDLSSIQLSASDWKAGDKYSLYVYNSETESDVKTNHKCVLKYNKINFGADVETEGEIAFNEEVNLGEDDHLDRPVLEIMLKSQLSYGAYKIKVERNGAPLRYRTLKIVEPDPVFAGLSIIYPGESIITDQNHIKFDKNLSRRGMLVRLDSNVVYPEISIGGLPLKPVKKGPYIGFYEAGAEWSDVIPSDLEKVAPALMVKKTLIDKLFEVELTSRIIDLPEPIIESSLNNTLNSIESNFTFKLRVKNVYGKPYIHYKNAPGSDLLPGDDSGTTQVTSFVNGVLSFQLTLDKSKFSRDAKSIEVIIRNEHGKNSEPYFVKLSQKPVGVTARLINKNSPYMAGFESPVEFKLASDEAKLNSNKEVKVRLAGIENTLTTNGLSLDRSSIKGNIFFPDSVEGDLNFLLIYFDENQIKKTIKGTFEGVKVKPEVSINTPLKQTGESYLVPKGQSFEIRSSVQENVELITPTEDLDFLSYPTTNLTNGKIKFTVNSLVPTDKEFKLSFRYGTHTIKTFDFKVAKGINLKTLLAEEDFQDSVRTFSGVENLKLKIYNEQPINYSGMKASLLDHTGTAIGDENYLISNESDYTFLIDVATTSIKPGDLFYIKLSNPGSESFKLKYYYKRTKLKDIIHISTGLSAGTIYFSEKMLNDSTNLPNAEFTNGINLTFTYNPNSTFFRGQNQRFSKQPIGLAFTLSALQGDKVRTRIGAGVNFFETIVVGIDRGIGKVDTRAGLYIGVVSSFANIAGLFGGG